MCIHMNVIIHSKSIVKLNLSFLIVLKYYFILPVVHIYNIDLSPDPHPPMFEFVYLRHICRLSFLLCD